MARWYAERGYEIVARNWRCAAGEIDLIVSNDSTLVFCEVKTRSGTAFGSAAESVTPVKQARLRKLAYAYLVGATAKYPNLRFDVGCVDGTTVEVIEAAF